MNPRDYLGKNVVVYAAFDSQRRARPMDRGKVIGYIDGPSIVVQHDDGTHETWPCVCPVEIDNEP